MESTTEKETIQKTTPKPLDWVESLKSFIKTKNSRLPEEIEKETDEEFLKIMQKIKDK